MLLIAALVAISSAVTWRFPGWHTFACWCFGFFGFGYFVEPYLGQVMLSPGFLSGLIYAPIGMVIVVARGNANA